MRMLKIDIAMAMSMPVKLEMMILVKVMAMTMPVKLKMTKIPKDSSLQTVPEYLSAFPET